MTKPTPTPTPLLADLTVDIEVQGHAETVVEIINPKGETVGYVEPDNAAFIVQVVNYHSELLKALKDAKAQLQKVCSWHMLTEEQSAGFNGVEDILDEAISKASEGL